jgi:hypothetical protein
MTTIHAPKLTIAADEGLSTATVRVLCNVQRPGPHRSCAPRRKPSISRHRSGAAVGSYCGSPPAGAHSVALSPGGGALRQEPRREGLDVEFQNGYSEASICAVVGHLSSSRTAIRNGTNYVVNMFTRVGKVPGS